MLRRTARSRVNYPARVKAFLLFGAAACLLALVACHEPAANSNQTPPVVSAPPRTTYPLPPAKDSHAEMGWTIASGQHVRLTDYLNKVVILDFYATWCGPCRMSIPNLVELQKRYGDQGLQVVGLNVSAPEDLEKVPAFARALHIQYQLGAPDPDLERLYRGDDDAIPLTVVLDRQGKQVYRVPGYGASTDQEVEEAVQKSLAAKGPIPSAE